MQVAVIVAGAVAEFAGWWFVSSGRADVWKLMPVVLGTMGVAAVLVRPPVAATRTGAITALLVGLGVGLALYVGTRVFVWLAARWSPFRRDVLEKYGQAGVTAAQLDPRARQRRAEALADTLSRAEPERTSAGLETGSQSAAG